MYLTNVSQLKQQQNKYTPSLMFYHIYITSTSADTNKHCGRTPLNLLSLITISLEWVHELSSFLLKRILKYTIIKMHSASFFINGSNGAYKVARCVACYILGEKTDSIINSPHVDKNMGPLGDDFCVLECGFQCLKGMEKRYISYITYALQHTLFTQYMTALHLYSLHKSIIGSSRNLCSE